MNNITWILLKYQYSYILRTGSDLGDNLVQYVIDGKHQGPEKLSDFAGGHISSENGQDSGLLLLNWLFLLLHTAGDEILLIFPKYTSRICIQAQ